MLLALSLSTAALAVLSWLPLWRHQAWWVRGLDFPRLQLLLITLALLTADFLALDRSRPATWFLVATAAACLAHQAWWIVPYTRLFPAEVRPAARPDARRVLKILTANVLTTNRNAAGLIELVRECVPHVLVTLESDAWWQAELDALAADYPHSIECPLDNLYGMHVYSRLPLADSQIEYLVEPDVPSIHTSIVLRSGHSIRAHFLHPAPPSPTENEESSQRDAELIVVAKSVAGSADPIIVTGDLNDVAWSATTRLFRKISGLLDPRVGRGMFNTFHAGYWFVRWPLDHIFHSGHFSLVSIRRLRGFGSDHFPLLTELALEGSGAPPQEGLEENAVDRSWAREKTEDLDVDEGDVPQPGSP